MAVAMPWKEGEGRDEGRRDLQPPESRDWLQMTYVVQHDPFDDSSKHDHSERRGKGLPERMTLREGPASPLPRVAQVAQVAQARGAR
jgi:hypothetical protein